MQMENAIGQTCQTAQHSYGSPYGFMWVTYKKINKHQYTNKKNIQFNKQQYQISKVPNVMPRSIHLGGGSLGLCQFPCVQARKCTKLHHQCYRFNKRLCLYVHWFNSNTCSCIYSITHLKVRDDTLFTVHSASSLVDFTSRGGWGDLHDFPSRNSELRGCFLCFCFFT